MLTFQVEVFTTFSGATWGARMGDHPTIFPIIRPPIGVWSLATATLTAPISASTVAFRVDNLIGGTTPITTGSILSLRNPMVTLNAQPYSFADGDSPGWKWEGTPGVSTSIGWPKPLQ